MHSHQRFACVFQVFHSFHLLCGGGLDTGGKPCKSASAPVGAYREQENATSPDLLADLGHMAVTWSHSLAHPQPPRCPAWRIGLRGYPLLMTMPRLACFLHIPSIREGAKHAFSSSIPSHLEPRSSDLQVSPWKIAQLLCRKATSRYQAKADLVRLSIYSDLGTAHSNKTHQARLKMHKAWRRETKGIIPEINTGGEHGKGLEVKLALDFVDLRQQSRSDIDIAVMFAMDREPAPAAEQIIRQHNELGIEVWVAMWALKGEDRERFLPGNIRPEIYQQVLLDRSDFLQVRDENNYTAKRRNLSKRKRRSVGQAQEIISNIADEEGRALAGDLGQALREQFPNHPATTGGLVAWFEQESMKVFFDVERINQNRIYICVR